MIKFLGKELVFPSAEHSTSRGIVAIGGDLTPERLLVAYRNGIFPWYNAGDPIIWWSLDPRLVLFPKNIKVSKSMRPYFNQEKYTVTYNTSFLQVIKSCQKISRENQKGTWITEDIISAYQKLFDLGYVISVEVWEGNDLVGGLYGVDLGTVFCGESMFALRPNASKFGLIKLAQKLYEEGYQLIDCQQETEHLKSLGAETIKRQEFLKILENLGIKTPNH